MRELAAIIDAGNWLYQAVMGVDGEKHKYSKAEIEVFTTALTSAFAAEAALRFKPRIRFCDLDVAIKYPAHRQLCFVEIDGARCTLNFHVGLLAPEDISGGLIFVAKSWPLMLLLDGAYAQGLAFSENFVFEIGDDGTFDSGAFCSNNARACLILDYEFLCDAGYQDFREACARNPVAWIDRGDKVFWRGASTGRRLNEPPAEGEDDDFCCLQRLRLCVAAKNPAVIDRCDIGLSQIVQISQPHLRKRILKAPLVKGFAPREQFAKQKFVVDIDGNSNAWSGLFLALHGGSCVLKVESPEGYRQ
jgi:hypothetical protein